MATSKTNQTSSDFEEYIRDLLECPVCKETIKSVPVYQCNNGHVICNECIRELTSCPICRNNSKPARSLKLEKIVQRLEGVLPENEGTITAETFNPQKWGKGSVRVYGTINGPYQEHRFELNLQANPRQTTIWINDPAGEALRGDGDDKSLRRFFCVLFGRFIIFCLSWSCVYFLYFLIKYILGW